MRSVANRLRVIQERNGSNMPTVSYTRGTDLSGSLEGSGYRWHWEYDDENRLVALYFFDNIDSTMEQPLAVEDWHSVFVYDGMGRLRQRVDHVAVYDEDLEMFVWEGAGFACYVYDGWRVIQERNSVSTPVVSYTRGTDLSGSLEGAGGIGGLLARSHGYSSGNWSTHNFYHADGNGNVTYLVNSSQGLAASYRYDPYGRTISSSGSLASANGYRFSSKEHFDRGIQSGWMPLYYYGYRWYAPIMQRWVNRDPIGERGGLNLYVMANNSPLNFSDYFGLKPEPGCAKACYAQYGACLTFGVSLGAACNFGLTGGCAVSCAGSGPIYSVCLFLCNSARIFGCGVISQLISRTCGRIKDDCLASCPDCN